MPSINRIRVNNVKYNFGTQQYDDFSMRMYGKNTLYDLANGGGKSILMLLLLQNLIPNCTLDDKQPVEKLFRTGGGNTVIHSLIEWKLDAAQIEDGYRYMTTGFCARKAKDAADEGNGEKDTAAIEYFNYCIFYREYNQNDIINLPLSKGNEKITYSGLRTYLKELAHKDLGLEIKVFEKKGEYQRFISRYGLYESHWEIIRGINKTEGHVRTYFETHYKTTRKVVEDLLIEEIIEKAFQTKTGRNGEEDTMAQTLLDIKDKLNALAQKKRDIAGFDHQIELINVLEAKVNSCMGLYKEHDEIAAKLADVYVTGQAFADTDRKHMEELAADKDERYARKEGQKRRLENLKITRDQHRLEELQKKIEEQHVRIQENEKKIQDIRHSIHLKESINDYLGYLEDERQRTENQLIVENIMKHVNADSEKMAVYAWNRKNRDDIRLKELLCAKTETEKAHDDARMELTYHTKLQKEAEITLAVSDSRMRDARDKIARMNEELSALSKETAVLVIGDSGEMYQTSEQKKQELETQAEALEQELEAGRRNLYEKEYILRILEKEMEQMQAEYEQQKLYAKEYRQASAQFQNILSIYHVEEPAEIADAISARIESAHEEIRKRRQEIERYKDREKYLLSGRLFGPSEGVIKVMEYIRTRHGHMAMHGADYLSALPKEKRAELLAVNPALPYGIVMKHFEDIADDIHLGSIDTGNECVCIYDIEHLSEKAVISSENMVLVGRNADYFSNETVLEKLKEETGAAIMESEQEIALIHEKLAAYQEDLKFVHELADEKFIGAEEKEREAKQKLIHREDEIRNLKAETEAQAGSLSEQQKELENLRKQHTDLSQDARLLFHMDALTEKLRQEEECLHAANADYSRAESRLEELKSEIVKWDTTVRETTARLETIAHNIEEIQLKWNRYFEPYYHEENPARMEVLTIEDERLESEFMALYAIAEQEAPDVEDKKKLIEALSQSMQRTRRSIEKRGITLDELAALAKRDALYMTDEASLRELDEELSRLTLVSAALTQQAGNDTQTYNKLLGSIEYAIANVNRMYGENSYEKEEISFAEAERAIENGDKILKELENQYQSSLLEYETCYREQGFMLDLYKDVKRIVDTNDLDVSRGKVLNEEKERLREIFETSLMQFDKSRKSLDRAKNDIVRFKGQTAEAFSEMGVFEMANTIRTDVTVPDSYTDAKQLLDNLLQIIAFINLEKERVEKGIEDMVAIKDNFENQCIQRCMDVRTELEKLPKLSRITVGDELIQMVNLSIPYVKEEFLKQRMSEYIDELVKNADSYEDERKRIRYIRDSLALKKLFGVVVTDMNAIRLKLYKRERIREQSRYLKYEEAVGSTGQSQGIYIQFLVAIINYIAGMYSYGPEDEMSTKTIFIDNPFGAAKDIYIWEPIFAMLAANHVQLIVPARGATPAITGRFDVNYVLGQQMVGGRQQTVVIDYTSKTNQEELEYQELTYEQATFDFI